MTPGARRLAGATAFVGATLLAMWLLWLPAGALTRHALQREAASEWTAWQAGTSPWQWQLRRADDVVSGHAFGHAQLKSVPGGLEARSLDGSAYDIGLPLPRDADLTRTPRLRADIKTSAATRLWLELRQRADAQLCLTSVTPAGDGRAQWLLPELTWSQADGQPCATPARAALLRLRIQQPAGGTLTLGNIALLPRTNQRPTVSSTPIALPDNDAVALHILKRTAVSTPPSILPQVQLPAHASPERLLALRDVTHTVLPAAIVLPATVAWPASTQPPAASHPSIPTWLGLSLYALALLWLAWRPPPGRWRAWLEIAGCLAGPLWLIAGLHLRLHTSALDVTAFGLGLAFAVCIQWRARPRDWHWGGDSRAWLLPLALLPVALLLAAALTTYGINPPDARHALIYLLWAVLQQWLMLTVVLGRLRSLLPAYAAILACAVLFALMHTPNAHLMQLCLLAELWWAWCFLRSRALLPIALAHALCALLLQAALSGGWLRSLEVSARYFAGG